MHRHIAIAAIFFLAACEGKAGSGAEANATGEAEPSASSADAETGQFSLKVPGFEVKVDMPQEGVRTGEDGDVIYPGSRLTGMNIDGGKGATQESVEIRFRSADPVDQVAAWYRDPARSGKFSVSRFSEEGDGYRLSGTQKNDGGSFDLWLTPGEGGTSGRMILRDRS